MLIKEEIKAEIDNISQDDNDYETKKQQLLAECMLDVGLTAQIFLPDRFYLPFSRQHEQVIEVLNDETIEKAVFTAWRGGGKSSLLLAKFMRDIIFRVRRFLVWASKSATHAEVWTENLKMEMAMSEPLKKLGFGSMRTKKINDYDQGYSKKAWTASFPGEDNFMSLVLPRGQNQQFRGLSYGPHRIGLLAPDDYEDDDEVLNEELRKKTKTKFIGSVCEAVQQHKARPGEPISRIIYIDTVKHEDALILHLIESGDWIHKELSLCTPTLVSLAPDFMSTEKVKQKYAYYKEIGELDTFAREFMCQPISREDAVFKQELFKYYREDDREFRERMPNFRTVVLVDPAKTAKMKSARTGIIVWSICTETNAMYLRYAGSHMIHPNEMYTITFDLAAQYNASIVGVESTGLAEFVMHPFRDAAMRLGKGQFEILELKAKKGTGEFAGQHGGKRGRVAALVPYYRQGLIYHNDQCAEYELQLLGYPRSKYWDMMDGAAYIVEVMDTMTLFFLPEGTGLSIYTNEGEYDDIPNDYNDSDTHNESFQHA